MVKPEQYHPREQISMKQIENIWNIEFALKVIGCILPPFHGIWDNDFMASRWRQKMEVIVTSADVVDLTAVFPIFKLPHQNININKQEAKIILFYFINLNKIDSVISGSCLLE